MDNRQLDKLLTTTAVRQAKVIIDSLPSDEELEQISPSQDFTQRMQKILAESEKRQKKQQSRKRLGKIVASIVLVFAITFGAVMSASASGANVVHFFERYFAFNSGKVETWNTQFNAQIIDNVHDVYLPTWVPAGFKVTESSQGGNVCLITYKSSDKTIRFTQSSSPFKEYSDDELKNMDQITISNQKYYYGEKGSGDLVTRKLIWQTDEKSFAIVANTSKDDLIKFATNIEFKKG